MIESTRREDQLDQRLQSMYDEIKNQRRDFDFEKRDAEFETKKQQAQIEYDKREVELSRHEAEIEARQRELDAKQAQFQSIIDQYYLSNGVNNGLVFGMAPPQRQPSSIDDTQSLPITLNQSDLDAARVELTSKMDEITQRGKQMKRVVKELEIQRYDLIRKQLELDNHMAQAEEYIKSKQSDIESQEEMIRTALFELESKQNITKQLFNMLCPHNPDILCKDPAIMLLFDESINNPIAMEKLRAIVDFKLDLEVAKKMVAIPDDEFSHFYNIIQQCNKNSKRYGAALNLPTPFPTFHTLISNSPHMTTTHSPSPFGRWVRDEYILVHWDGEYLILC